MIKTVIFDMDGTLINSDALVEKIYRELVKKYPPIVTFDSLDLNRVMALSYVEVINILYGEVKKEYLDYIMHVHAKEKKGQLALFPNIKVMLESLKNEGYYLAVVTSELREIAVDEMQILEILPFFDEVIAFDDVTHPKPHPEGILRILANSHAKPYEAIMVGDQLSDTFAASKAHVMSIFMGWDENKLKTMAVHYDEVARDTNELINLIHSRQKLTLNFDKNHAFTICQITDLHLMNDEQDRGAKVLIEKMVNQINPDFIALTGDQSMGKDGLINYRRLGQWMDEQKVPYGLVFGNHDTEGGTYLELIKAIHKSSHLMFSSGPEHLGYSNYFIEVYDQNDIKTLLIMMDSHIDDMYDIDGKKVWGYGTINPQQMAWYERLILRYPNIPSILFLHIPPYEVRHVKKENVNGCYEESPSTPPIDTGFVSLIKKHKHTKAIFYGHDHYNDFTYQNQGLILAYGRVSGYYVYGREGFTPGVRWIKLDTHGQLASGIITMDDLL